MANFACLRVVNNFSTYQSVYIIVLYLGTYYTVRWVNFGKLKKVLSFRSAKRNSETTERFFLIYILRRSIAYYIINCQKSRKATNQRLIFLKVHVQLTIFSEDGFFGFMRIIALQDICFFLSSIFQFFNSRLNRVTEERIFISYDFFFTHSTFRTVQKSKCVFSYIIIIIGVGNA
jgi:hypothetical protein